MKTTQLPYLGPHVETTKRVINKITRAIPFSELHDYEIEQVEARLGSSTDPFDVLANKVEHLSDILGCSEAEAERVLFERIGNAAARP